MAKIDLLDMENKKIGEIELREEIFGVPVREHLLYETVKWQLACRRRGTASTKTRGEVSGGGVKPWRQKGTGRARAGSIRSPLWRGGGVVFGPHPRDYSYRLPKSARREALKSALALKCKEGAVKVVKDLVLPEIKTKRLLEILKNLGAVNSLIVMDKKDEKIEKSARNLPFTKIIRFEGLNVYDILRYENLVLTEASLEKIEGVLAGNE